MRVHIHTDSPFFSGAENMIANLLASDEMVREFGIVFSYRSSPEFERGLAERVRTRAELRPLELLDVPSRTDHLPAPARLVAKAAAYASGARYRYLRENTRRIEVVLRETKPDLLHVNSGGYPGAYSTIAAVLAARAAGVPRVVYVANNIAVPYTWRRALDRPVDRRVAETVDAFVTGSVFAADALSRVLDLPPGRVRTIPNGISPRGIVEAPADLRRRIGAPDGRPVVAVVANLERRKGHEVLFRALGRLKQGGFAPLPWVAVEGVGPEEGRLRGSVAALGLARDVAFLGRERRVFDLMNAADILALPSIAHEDFPNVVLEAMSVGKPVVASRIAGTPEQVVDGETGLLVPPGDDAALADALAVLAADAVARSDMGLAGKARFDACFRSDRALSAYAALYRELL